MKIYKLMVIFAVSMIIFNPICLYAACPLDHFEIGRNTDGIEGTDDDLKLFVDCSQIYRHSDPLDNQNPTWTYWHYPLYYSVIYRDYNIGEPGFDTIKADDPNHCLQGTPLVDYNIIVECVSITPGVKAKNNESTPYFTLQAPGDSFSHSSYSDPHLHMKYRTPTADRLLWITFRLYDALGMYQPSDEFSIVFIEDPLAGDLVIDGAVDMNDVARFCYYWLQIVGGKSNDYYERADSNKDGRVDFVDFAMLAKNWLRDATY